ncbi:hypothetical protein, partial [Rhizobium leguminosarum]|uniref:hypothetical protein n=1 Tax=Rhizobium leguminosarum TaxID=384 RepID=UPI003F94E9D5
AIFCKCFTLSAANSDNPTENEFFDSCLQNSSKGLEKDLQKMIGYDSSHPDEKLAYEFGQNLLAKNVGKLIYQCDAFFILMDKSLMDGYRNVN